MNPQAVQVGSVSVISVLAVFTTYRLARRELLSFQYTLGWLLLFSLGVFSFFIFNLISPFASALSITPAALLSLVGAGILCVICLQLSISISGLHQRIRVLTEEIAHLKIQSKP